jgi:hypothetical protein
MSSEVEIRLTAVDEASDVINQVAGNVQNANSQITNSTNQVTDATESASASVRDTALGFNNMATAGMGLYMSIERVENSQVMLDRANLNVERSTLAVNNAQDAYNKAVAKFGADSPQAQAALEKLKVAQDALQVSQERQEMAQRNLNNTMMMSALTVIPSLITMVTSIATVAPLASGAVSRLSGALDFLAANPIVLVIAAVAALVVGIIYAYNNFKPFHDLINTVGAVLSGFFATAITVVTNALSFLWNNILAPLIGVFKTLWDTIMNNPILAFLFGPITAVVYLIEHWNSVTVVVRGALEWLWNNILVPLGDFIKGAFGAAINFVTSLLEKLYGIIKPLVDALGTVKDVMGGVVGAISGALSDAGKAIGGFISSICFAHALATAAEDSAKTMSGWVGMVQDSMTKGLGAIKDFNSQVQGPGAPASVYAPAGPMPTAPAAKTPITVNITSPLINVEGSADRKTVEETGKKVMDMLKSVLVEPTSSAAYTTLKRVRQ